MSALGPLASWEDPGKEHQTSGRRLVSGALTSSGDKATREGGGTDRKRCGGRGDEREDEGSESREIPSYSQLYALCSHACPVSCVLLSLFHTSRN